MAVPHKDRAPQEVTPVRLAAAVHAARGVVPAAASAPVARTAHPGDEPPSREEIEHDVAAVRRRALATGLYGAGTVALASSLTVGELHSWPMYAIPAVSLAMFFGLATLAGTVWTWLGARRLGEAGISVFDAVDGGWRALADRAAARDASRAVPRAEAGRAPAPPSPARAVASSPHVVPASREVLGSRWGDAVRRAVDDRAAIAHLVDDLGPADRAMIPDVLPTADLLVRRVGELAATLHALDASAPLLADVERRLAEARETGGAAPDADQARRMELLERQRESLADLAHRREQLGARIESAGLMLQNMRLDLLRLRSAGIESALGEISSVTREAGTLSRDIGRALDVARELGKE